MKKTKISVYVSDLLIYISNDDLCSRTWKVLGLRKSDNIHTVKGLYTQSFVTLNLKGKFIWKQVHHECIEKLSYVRFTWKQIHDETLKRFCMLYKIFSVLWILVFMNVFLSIWSYLTFTHQWSLGLLVKISRIVHFIT